MNDTMLDLKLDATHATPEVVALLTSTFADKSSRDVERTMTHFAQELMTYTDTTLGDTYRNWSAQKSVFERFMSQWAEGTRSYLTRIIGDTRSALVVFVDSPEMFGREVRIMATVDFCNDKIIRQVDHWDGRQFGVAALEQHRLTAEAFPEDFGELAFAEQADPTMRRIASALADAFAAADGAAATSLFAPDAVLEDLTLRTAIVGADAIGGYLDRAVASLPYGPGTWVRHTVGSDQGGGYEWTSGGTVRNGVIALELDADARITRFTAMWDASRLDTATVVALVTNAVEA